MADVFDGKSLQDLLEEIHKSTIDKHTLIRGIILDIKTHIKSMDDLVCLAPILKDYIDVLIRNDEHLIKIGTIVQRIISAENYSKGGGSVEDLLSEHEKDALISIARSDVEKELESLNEHVKSIGSGIVTNVN